MELPAFLQAFDWSAIQGVNVPGWLIQFSVALLITYTASFFLKKIFTRLAGRVKPDTSLWGNAFLVAGGKPANFIVWVTGLGWGVDIIWQTTNSPLFSKFGRFCDVLVVVLLVWGLIRIIRQAENTFLSFSSDRHKKIDSTTAVAMGRLLRITVLISGLLVVMQALGYSISGILAFGGVGGLAVGFAAKDMLANFFGGLMIYLDKPFRVGDWIRSPDRQIEGTVQYIGWRQTRILTFEKRPLYVPNAFFMNISVENPSRMENRRIKETIGLRYSDARKVSMVLQEVRDYLHTNDVIDHNKIVMVNFTMFGPSSLDFFMYCFTKTTDWAEFHMVKEKVLLDVMSIIHKHGADIAFPTQTLDLPQNIVVPEVVIASARSQSA